MAKVKNELLNALSKLDKNHTGHWNSDGLPRLDVLKKFAGREVTRAELTKFAPEFSLMNPVLPEDTSWMDSKVEDESAPEDTTVSPAASDAPVSAVAEASSPSAEEAVLAPFSAAQPTDEIDLVKQIGEKETFLKQARERENRATREIEKAEKELAALIDAKTAKFPPMSQADATREFIAAQLQQRMDKAMSAKKLKEATGYDVNSKAPIDAAMQRGTGFNRGRPKVPLTAQG
jgi:hypothetical protein